MRSKSTNPWAVLPVLSLSVFLVVVDNTIVNVALPSFAHDLHSSNSGLQWIVDAYSLPFAGLLLFGGALGDRLGRKPVMQWGLVGFGATSVLATFAGSTGQLIAARALMGVTAAFIFPASLAILTTIFTDPKDRAKAIGVWSATSGLSVAMGPLAGGILLQHFWYGSVFLVSVPIVLAAVVLGAVLVPNSKSDHGHGFDLVGVVVGSAAVTTLVLTVIEAPTWGWGATSSILGYVASVLLLGLFIAVELRQAHPMLDVRVFANSRFSTGAASIAVGFFVLFGFIFMVTQYFQLVHGYSTLRAGVATLPFAATMAIFAPIFATVAIKVGTKLVVTFGLATMGTAMLMTQGMDVGAPFWGWTVISMVTMSLGLAAISAPATAAVMESLTPAQVGAGSAVNNVTRELGGTLGVAVVGSAFASVYAPRLREAWSAFPVPRPALDAASDSMAAATVVIHHPGVPSAAMDAMSRGANAAFVDAMHVGALVAGGVAFSMAVLVAVFLPARTGEAEFDDLAVAATER